MFSDRWQLLREVIDGCLFTTPDRHISHPQFLQLFQAFLLQVKESEGMVYIIQSEKNGSLATHFADTLMNSLKVSARGLLPIHKDVALQLLLLLKKTDLVITLGSLGQSIDTLSAAALTKANDVPLITLSGGLNDNLLMKQGDLNIHFDTCDTDLIVTGQFSLLNEIVDSWSYDSESPFPEQELFLPQTTSQNTLSGLRI